MNEILSLTGLRFIAAFAIVINHLCPVVFKLGDKVPFLHFYNSLANLGMSLFFVLSGFIIHYNYHTYILNRPLTGVYNFLIARFARLYPLFFVVLFYDLAAGNFFLYGSDQEKYNYLKALPYYLTMTQSWFYGFIGNHPITFSYQLTYVTWSISTEYFFYILYPFICYLLFKLTSLKNNIFICIVLLIAAEVMLLTLNNNLKYIDYIGKQFLGVVENTNATPKTIFSDWFTYISPYSRIFEFLIGCLTAHIYIKTTDSPINSREIIYSNMLLYFSIFSIVIVTTTNCNWYIWKSNTLTLWLAITVLCCARYNNSFSKIMSSRLLVTLGNASYSIYLLHIIIIEKSAVPNYVDYNATNVITLVFRATIIIASILVISLGIHRYFEIPSRKILRQLLIK